MVVCFKKIKIWKEHKQLQLDFVEWPDMRFFKSFLICCKNPERDWVGFSLKVEKSAVAENKRKNDKNLQALSVKKISMLQVKASWNKKYHCSLVLHQRKINELQFVFFFSML